MRIYGMIKKRGVGWWNKLYGWTQAKVWKRRERIRSRKQCRKWEG